MLVVAMTIVELIKKFEALPERQQEEVAEFVDFLASRYPEGPTRKTSARGKFADVGISSDDFAKQKSEEIDIEDR